MIAPNCPLNDLPIAVNACFRSHPSCGFLCWNTTEVDRVLDLARSLQNSCIVVVRGAKRRFKKADSLFNMDEAIFTEAGVPVVVWRENQLLRFDGFFDLIVCQASFTGINEIKESRVVTIAEGDDAPVIVATWIDSVYKN